jgi:hypothetical protein
VEVQAVFMRIDELTQIQETVDATISGERLCFVYNDATETTLTLAFSDGERIDDFIRVLTKWRHELDKLEVEPHGDNDVYPSVEPGSRSEPMQLGSDPSF